MSGARVPRAEEVCRKLGGRRGNREEEAEASVTKWNKRQVGEGGGGQSLQEDHSELCRSWSPAPFPESLLLAGGRREDGGRWREAEGGAARRAERGDFPRLPENEENSYDSSGLGHRIPSGASFVNRLLTAQGCTHVFAKPGQLGCNNWNNFTLSIQMLNSDSPAVPPTSRLENLGKAVPLRGDELSASSRRRLSDVPPSADLETDI
ncbi:hypothetical protein EYF80_005452 [Liparis tanakae]|uniref:Uncharacterized protein n=1 Tax=Liparis tanakae TaxID=230148 RepID=A0A4Z2J1D5_9TELE|nr:hypothetical protein EYF80_005452 [Liparis tanakae]